MSENAPKWRLLSTAKREESSRREIFKQEGYELLVIWERELKDTSALIRRIASFTEGAVCV